MHYLRLPVTLRLLSPLLHLLELHVVGLIHLLLVEGGCCIVRRSNQDLLSYHLVLLSAFLAIYRWGPSLTSIHLIEHHLGIGYRVISLVLS